MDQEIRHATAVSYADRGVMFTGPSGSGKSTLALEIMALGGTLISDDRCILSRQDGKVIVSAPPSIKGLIEARGVGILSAETVASVALSLIVDLSVLETERLPPQRLTTILAQSLPLLYKAESPNFSVSILQYLRGGRFR